jgi:hypothetical protein
VPISGAVGRGVEGALSSCVALGANGWALGEKGLARALSRSLSLSRPWPDLITARCGALSAQRQAD